MEGLAASLSQTGGLDPNQHNIIASALERDLLKRFNIGDDKRKSIEMDEESLLKDTEAYYIKSK